MRQRFVILTFSVCVFIAACCLLFELFGVSVVDSLYSRGGFERLNQLTGAPPTLSPEAYYNAISLLFYRFHFVLITGYLAIYGFCFLVHRFFFSSKAVPLTVAVTWATYMVVLIYLYNPCWRVFAFHGLFRARLSYQIMNGHIPPPETLLAGVPSQSPWGYPWLGARIALLLKTSPFHAYALINILAVAGVMILLYLISTRIFKNRKIGVLSSVVALFATTPVCRLLINHLNLYLGYYRIENRAVPICGKFTIPNGVPLGIFFYSLFILSLIDVFIDHKKRGYGLLAVSALGCGFFYPPFFPSIAGALLFFIGVKLLALQFKSINELIGVKPLILSWLTFLACIALLIPYFHTVGGTLGRTALFGPKQMIANTLNTLVALVPLGLFTVVYRKPLITASNRKALWLLLCILAANAGLYICVHLPSNNEYKFLQIAGVTLGILGGGAFYFQTVRHAKWACFLFVLFIVPSVTNFVRIITVMQTCGPFSTPVEKREFLENRTVLASSDPEKNELYGWILRHTPPEAVFVDSTLDLPVYCQRPLFVGLDPDEHTTRKGYSMTVKAIAYLNGYDLDTVNQRMAIVRQLYGLQESSDRAALLQSLRDENVRIVYRKNDIDPEFNTDGLTEIFTTSHGNFSLYTIDN